MMMSDWEIKIIQNIRDGASAFFDRMFEMFTFLGEKEVLIVLLILVYFAYSKKVGQRLAHAILNSLLINNAVKGLVKRARPWTHPDATYLPVRPETATGYSFPSGHTQTAAVTYTSFALLFKRRAITIVAVAMIVIIGFSRVYLGVHYPTDVLAAIALGVGVAFAGAYLHRKFEDSMKKQLLLYLASLVVFLPFVFVFWRSDFNNISIYRDFYTSYAFFAGFVAAVAIEHRFVNFSDKGSLKVKIIRSIIAIVLAVGVLLGLKALLPEENILMDMLRYSLIPVIVLGLYPLATKNILFFPEGK
jgi:membrane-associated phospholipid phosphatase